VSNLVSVEPETAEVQLWWEKCLLKIGSCFPRLKPFSASATRRKAVHGSAWTLSGYGATQLARLTTTVLLAHLLLGPRAFGLVALVNVFLTGLEMLSDLGVGLDVIQHPRGDESTFINTAFLIQCVRGVLLWGIAAGLAYPFALFYKQPAVLWLAIVGATSTGLRGFTSSSVWTMTRHVQLKKLTLLTIGSEIAGLIASVTWAIISPSAWALVIGKVASSLVFVVGTHLVSENSVSLQWDSRAAREILAFGAGIFLSTSAYFLTGEAERLVIGKFVNLVELGCFSLALTICATATTGLTKIVNQVFFPLLAQAVREDKAIAAKRYLRVRWMLLVVSCVLAVMFILGSHYIVAVLLGPRYAMTGWILQLLGVRAAFQLFMSINASALFAFGSAKYQATGNIAKLLLLMVGLGIAFTHFGFREAIWVLTISPIAVYVSLTFGLSRLFRSVLRLELLTVAIFFSCVGLAVSILPWIK
jgi:O-antigen/teichoic acid export membrane protein